ncbi:MAG TPA: adenylate/guanylate cyclase domain-containing protein [Micromonosporaceae bacterium]
MSRRLVVVLFLDLVGWTRLAERVDPEPLQQLLEQYYEICSSTVEAHGGVVEKFIGDAIMAVFGADTSQEDDALRALRTAFQIRAEVGDLRTPGADGPPAQIHCGIAAGEALVTRSARAGMRVVGDVVNLAARLQSAAVAGEIVVNRTVADLARRHFVMAPVPPLTLKGKAEPVPAFLVTGVGTGDRAPDGAPMVDRGGERTRLREAYRAVVRDRRSRLVAVLGPPGIGKTRLVAEAVGEFAADGPEPTAVFATCPSYGPTGNQAAVVQVLDALTRQSAPARDLVRTNSRVAAVVTSLRDAALSRRDGNVPGPGVEEASWAVRELLTAAATRPLVVVWDGLEWAGQSLLLFVGGLIDSLPDLPLLMICVARPELAERDVPWVRALHEHDVVDVRPLEPPDSAELAASLVAAGALPDVQAHALDLADRVLVDRATLYGAGNPLFIRLMLESATPGRPLDDIPASITAMVGAMIDRLPAHAQHLLGVASVVGSTFTAAQIALLDEPAPDTAVEFLVQRRLLGTGTEPGEYFFAQQAVHEVAYRRLDKQRRLAWHRRLAEHGVSPGFHFEAAVRLLGELRPDDAELGALAACAAEALLRDGTAALRQRDMPAATDLLERAFALVPPDGSRSVAAIRFSDALMLSGDMSRAVDVVTEVVRTGVNERDRRACMAQQHLLAARQGRIPETTVADLLAELDRDPTDHLAWCRFEQLRVQIHLAHGRFAAAERAVGAALRHARAIGDGYEEDRLLVALCEVRQWSPTPVAEKLAVCAELLDRFAADRFLLVPVLAAQARGLALLGDDCGARAALAEAEAAVDQLRLTMGQVLTDQATGLACSLHGDHVEAERHYRRAADALERFGYVPVALTLRVQAARELASQGTDPATPPVAGERDAARQIVALLDRRDEMDVRGRLLCMSAAVRLGVGGDPDALLGDILSLLERTDDPCLRGDVYVDLAQTHRRLGNDADADAMAGAAIDSYHAVGATRAMRAVKAWT